MRVAGPGRRRPRVVVVGAGFGGLSVVNGLRDVPVDVTLVDRHNHHLFQPLLYQVASGLLDPSAIAFPVRAILRHRRNCDFHLGDVTGVDVDARLVRTSTGDVPYDHLVLATGSTSNFFGNAGLESRAFGLKDLGEALALRARILTCFERASLCEDAAERRRLLTFVVVGAGPTGVEMTGALAELVRHVLRHDFPHMRIEEVDVVLVEATDRVLATFHPKLGRAAVRALVRKGARLRLRRTVTSVEPDHVALDDGSRIEAATIIWTAGVRAAVPGHVGDVATVRQGRIPVERDLNLRGHADVFAIGDVAALEENGTPLPMLAPVAIQQGEHVARTIRARVLGEPEPPSFRYVDKGTMATVGRNVAVAQIGRLHFSGFIGWCAWLFVHIITLIGFRNRAIVLMNWAWNYVMFDRPVRLIAGPTPPPAVPIPEIVGEPVPAKGTHAKRAAGTAAGERRER